MLPEPSPPPPPLPQLPIAVGVKVEETPGGDSSRARRFGDQDTRVAVEGDPRWRSGMTDASSTGESTLRRWSLAGGERSRPEQSDHNDGRARVLADGMWAWAIGVER